MILLVCPARGGQSEPQGGLGCTHATAPRLESPTDADSTSLRQNVTLPSSSPEGGTLLQVVLITYSSS